MSTRKAIEFEGETNSYRLARNELLEAEKNLRRQVEAVAYLRRQLPDGHVVKQDYEFEEVDATSQRSSKTRLSELFLKPDKSLVIYHFMYPDGGKPCPMCTAFLDSFDAVAMHAKTELNIAVVAKGTATALHRWAQERSWNNLRILSTGSNTFNFVYQAETDTGVQLPLISVFKMHAGIVRHFYTTELFFEPREPEQDPRHVDLMFPLWSVFDLTPDGRPNKQFWLV